jgi:hypothetical protein
MTAAKRKASAAKKGKPRKPMVRRSEVEVEVDRAYLMSLALKMGRAFTIAAAGDALNERRFKLACDVAESKNKPLPSREACSVGPSQLSKDYHAVMDRIRATQEGAAALFVDSQIEAVERDISRTEALDEEILQDLQRSRGVVKEIEYAESNGGSKPKAVPRRMTIERYVDGPADPALYGALHRNLLTRQKLRQELRALRFGREYLSKLAAAETPVVSFVEAISGGTEPRAALQAAYEQEVASLLEYDAVSYASFVPEIARAEAARAKRLLDTIRSLKTGLTIPSSSGKPDRFVFEVVGIEEGA